MLWFAVEFTRDDVKADRISAMLFDYMAALAQSPVPEAAIFSQSTEAGGMRCFFSPDASRVFADGLKAWRPQQCDAPRQAPGLDLLAGDPRHAWPQVRAEA